MFFALGHESAELSSRQIGDLDPYSIKASIVAGSEGDVRSAIAHDQYLPLLEQVQVWTNELKGLSPRHCYVKVDNKKAVKVRTLSMPTPRVDRDELEAVLATYRSLYQRSRAEAEQKMHDIHLPAVPERDDVVGSVAATGLDWERG